VEPAKRNNQDLQACRSGDPAAFGRLVREHQRSVFGLALRMARGDEQFARDITQRTFEQAWKGRASFRGDASFKTWVLRIATNLGRNELRRAWRHREVVPVTDGEGNDVGRSEATALEDMARDEARGALRGALDALPDRQREVALLRIYDDLTFAEVGDVLGITANNAKVNFHHAVKRLKQLLEPAGAGS